jgi:hypothetical protein
MKKSKFSRINFSAMKSDVDKPAGVAVGLITGMAANKMLDTIFPTKPLSGVVGIEMAQTTKNIVKPMVLIVGGLAAYQLSKTDFAKSFSAGLAGSGVVLAANNLFKKNFLAGTEEEARPMASPEPMYLQQQRPALPTEIVLPNLQGDTKNGLFGDIKNGLFGMEGQAQLQQPTEPQQAVSFGSEFGRTNFGAQEEDLLGDATFIYSSKPSSYQKSEFIE